MCRLCEGKPEPVGDAATYLPRFRDAEDITLIIPVAEQPAPTPGGQAVTPLVRQFFEDILAARERKGIATYGTTLQTHNGRDPLWDAIEECVDQFQYLVQAYLERADQERELKQLREHRCRP